MGIYMSVVGGEVKVGEGQFGVLKLVDRTSVAGGEFGKNVRFVLIAGKGIVCAY